MAKRNEKQWTSRDTAVKVIYAAMQILKKAGGSLPGREVIAKVGATVELSDWEKERFEKTGNIRWRSLLHLWSIDLVKAGYLRKKDGTWYITVEGEKALKMGAEEFLESASIKYKEWKKNREVIKDDDIEDKDELQLIKLDELEETALEGLKEYIVAKNPYEFQDIVAALLRAMGYYTPFIAPRGKDGGIDIVAYQDPLGAKTPRIKVQVKHQPETTIPVKDIKSLIGVINKNGEIGLFITSGKFSSEAQRFTREAHIHCKLMDFTEFISLWKQFYSKLTDEEKNMLPLHPIYFLGSNE